MNGGSRAGAGRSGRVLVVVGTDVASEEVGPLLANYLDPDAEVKLIAPASGVSRLEWLANAEDDAREDAADRASAIAEALPGDTVDDGVGDADPLLAIADALRSFDADEIIVVGRPEDEAPWLESGAARSASRSFDLPVTHLVVG